MDIEENQKSMMDFVTDDPKAKGILRNFKEKSINSTTVAETVDFLEHQYLAFVEESSQEFMKRVDFYKNFPFFRDKFFDFQDPEMKSLSKEDYDIKQKTKFVELSINGTNRMMEAISESDKKTMTKLMLYIELQKNLIEKMKVFIESGVSRRPGIPFRRAKGSTQEMAMIWERIYQRTGQKPTHTEVAKEFNLDRNTSEMITTKSVLQYVKNGYNRMVKDGKLTVEEVAQRGVNLIPVKHRQSGEPESRTTPPIEEDVVRKTFDKVDTKQDNKGSNEKIEEKQAEKSKKSKELSLPIYSE